MSAEIYTLKTGDLVAEQKTEERYDSLVGNIYNCLNVELMQLMDQMLDNCDDVLAVLSKNTETNTEEQSQKMTALRMLCHQRSNISSNFFFALNENLKSSALDKDSTEEELSLVDQEEMEEMVAITTMHANALNLFGDEISNLEARLEYLEIQSAKIFGKHAINPNKICEAFRTTLAPLSMTTTNKLVLLKVFDEQVNLQLGDMYQAINKLLIDEGILPEIVLTTQTYEEPEEEEVATRTARYYDPSENKSTDFVPRSQSELNHIISQFMKGTFTATGNELELPESFYKDPEKQNIDGKECYARKDVVKSLSRLQRKLTELGKKSELVSAEEIKRSLMSDIDKNNKGKSPKEVNVLDERSIDFVGMMFNAITTDESISGVIKNLLMRLQIPVIKVAMSDEELFSNENHPARNVLNLVTEAGKGVTEEEDRLYGDLNDVVNEILQEYDVDIKSFDKAVDALHEIIKNEETLAFENEKIAQKEAIKSHARNIVLTELRGLSTNKKIPKPVQPLILKHWSTLMLNRYINYGKDSNQWAQSVMLVKLMLKLLQPIKKKAQWHMLNNNHLALVESVNDELYATRQDKEGIDEQIESLKTTFQTMLDNYGLKVVDNETDNINANIMYDTEDMEAASDEATISDEQLRIAKEKLAQLPSNAKPGVWFEIFNGEDHAIRRLKMSVVLTEVAKIIFVNRKGIKVIEKDIGEFVDELKTEKSRFIADHSTFDHALGKVIGAMAA